MSETESSARLLFTAALATFVVTILSGILNGMGIWDPSHNMMLTHVHAGTLGWITLAVFGAAIRMFGGEENSLNVVTFAVVATALYVVAFATTTGVFRPIAGTLELAAIVWMLVWVVGRYGSSVKTTGQVGVLLAMSR